MVILNEQNDDSMIETSLKIYLYVFLDIKDSNDSTINICLSKIKQWKRCKTNCCLVKVLFYVLDHQTKICIILNSILFHFNKFKLTETAVGNRFSHCRTILYNFELILEFFSGFLRNVFTKLIMNFNPSLKKPSET